MPNNTHLDYIETRRVFVTIPNPTTDIHEHLIHNFLPVDYSFKDGNFTFPVETQETYIVNGKNYNPDGHKTPEKQREELVKDLEDACFETNDIFEIIDGIKRVEREEIYLDRKASKEWIDAHPLLVVEALNELKKYREEVNRYTEGVKPK
jgi:hypothetical protein